MKKVFLVSALCLTSSLFLFGCGNGQDASLTNLANQLDLLNNTVNSVSRTAQEIPSLSSLTKEQAINYSGIYQSTKDIVANQNCYKTAILTKTNLIKNKIANKELKLTSQNIKALTDLTQSLSRDTKRLNETKSEFKNSITDINKSISSNKASISQVNAKLNKLSNCMETQDCYYKNLLNTLNNIENIMEIYDDSFDFSNLNLPPKQFDKEKADSQDFEKLFYQYMLNQNLNNENKDENKKDEKEPTNSSYNQVNAYPVNPYYGYYGGYNPYFYGNNMGQNYMPYGYYNGYYNFRTNPYRNTDTYAPYMRNIDTYRAPTGMRNNQNQSTPVFNNETKNNKDEIKLETVQDEEKIVTSINLFNKEENTAKTDKKSPQSSRFAGKTYEMLKNSNNKLNTKTFFKDKAKGHTKALSFPFSKKENLESLIRKKV